MKAFIGLHRYLGKPLFRTSFSGSNLSTKHWSLWIRWYISLLSVMVSLDYGFALIFQNPDWFRRYGRDVGLYSIWEGSPSLIWHLALTETTRLSWRRIWTWPWLDTIVIYGNKINCWNQNSKRRISFDLSELMGRTKCTDSDTAPKE